MQKCILNIKLVNRQAKLNSKRKNQSHYGVFDYQAKSVTVVNTPLLVEPLGYKTGLLPFNSAIRPLFDFIDPATSYNIFFRR